MKITFIISSIGAPGGTERFLISLANELCQTHQIEIIVLDRMSSFYPLDAKVEIAFVARSDKGGFWNKMAVFFALRKELKKRRGETDVLVAVSSGSVLNIISILLCPKAIPIIASDHNAQEFQHSKFWRTLRKATYSRADAVTVLFQKDALYYKKFVQNVEVFPNPSAFRSDKEEIVEKENLVILVARLTVVKNVSMFIAAISMLDEELKSLYRFCVLGEGELKDQLEQEAVNHGVRVEFLGPVKNVGEYYKKAKIICLSSHVEGLPMTLIESLFFGTARISTKSSDGVRELIEDKEDGFLVEKDDAWAMSERMALLMRDEDLRQEIVQRANKKRDMFDVKNIAKQWMDLIHEVKGKGITR